VAAYGNVPAARDAGQLVDHRGDLGHEFVAADHRPRVGVVDDVLDLAATQPVVERHHHRADLDRGAGDLEELMTVVQHDRELVAAPEAEPAERVRELIDAAVPLGPRVAHVVEDDGGAVGEILGVGGCSDLHEPILLGACHDEHAIEWGTLPS
jgi:hypothetical protein